MKLGSNDIGSVYIGSTAVNKIYIGSTEVWSSFTGLLDTYTGAAAAYSLRQLKSGVTNAIRVRRASDNAETNIGFVSGQLDTSTLETFCSGTDGYVTTWYDQSGNGYNATQSTSANQPQIVSSGSVITDNGKPAVQFNGTSTNIKNSSLTLSQPSTHILVIKNDSNNNAHIVDRFTTSGDRQVDYLPSDEFSIYAGTQLNSQVNIGTTQKMFFNIFNSTTSNIRYNGSSIITGNAGTQGLTGLNLGSNSGFQQYYNGKMQEIILYNSDQSSNSTGIESNINAQYQIYWDGSQTSLLDTYGGSAAAYSLRALSSSYTGALIKVRRASDNAEQDIYAKYDGTLNTDALESFCSGTNGFVTTWYDQSGNGNDATQSTAANQPQIVSSGSVILQNGKPSIQSTSINCELTLNSVSANPLYIFTSFNKGTKTSNAGIIGSWTPTLGWAILSSWYASPNDFGLINYDTSSVRTNSQSGDILTSGNDYLITSVFSDKMYYYKNSNLISTSASIVNTRSTSSIQLFAYAPGVGVSDTSSKIQEIILYNSDQSSNRTGIETNINNFYNIY